MVKGETYIEGKKILKGTRSARYEVLWWFRSWRFDIRWKVAAPKDTDCRLEAWVGSDIDSYDSAKRVNVSDPNSLTYIRHEVWAFDVDAGKTEGSRDDSFMIDAFFWDFNVRTDCATWSLEIRPVALSWRNVPGAPRGWLWASELDCGDFKSKKDAQAFRTYFEWDPMWLDLDNDGEACELGV